MDKKDIYEHLAKIYLDASLNRKKQPKEYPKLFRHLFLVSITLVFILFSFLVARQRQNPSLNSQIALVLNPEVVKINFHFDPARRETYTVSLNNLNLSRFKALAFSVKKANYRDDISLRVEFTSHFKEKSATYFKDIPHKWQEYQIELAEFKGISDWSNMADISFIVEEWNVREKRGEVFVDNIRFLK